MCAYLTLPIRLAVVLFIGYAIWHARFPAESVETALLGIGEANQQVTDDSKMSSPQSNFNGIAVAIIAGGLLLGLTVTAVGVRQNRTSERATQQMRKHGIVATTDSARLGWFGFSVIECDRVDLRNAQLPNGYFPPVNQIRSLVSLNVSLLPLSSADCTQIGKCQDLETLVLDGTEIDDECLAKLASLKHLKSLSVKNTHVSLAGTEKLLQSVEIHDLEYDDA